MGKKKPYEFNGIYFGSQTEAKKYITDIRDTYTPGQELSDPHLKFMLAVLENHPNVEQKVGVGVRHMTVDWEPGRRGTLCFYLHRTDETSTDFSFTGCLKAKTPFQYFKEACRTAIKDQTQKFSEEQFEANPDLQCPIDGIPLHKGNSDVDHFDPNFDMLVVRFIRDRQIDLQNVKISGVGEDNSSTKDFKDPDLKAAFAAYHQEHAQLRVVSKSANRSPLKRGYKKTMWDEAQNIYFFGPSGATL